MATKIRRGSAHPRKTTQMTTLYLHPDDGELSYDATAHTLVISQESQRLCLNIGALGLLGLGKELIAIGLARLNSEYEFIPASPEVPQCEVTARQKYMDATTALISERVNKWLAANPSKEYGLVASPAHSIVATHVVCKRGGGWHTAHYSEVHDTEASLAACYKSFFDNVAAVAAEEQEAEGD